MNKLFLKLVMLPAGLWRRMGADTGQLGAILNMRLLVDDRKPLSMRMNRGQNEQRERKHGSILSMFVFLLTGLIYAMPLLFISDRVFSIAVNLSLLFLMLTLSLVTDFSNTLFDNRDKYILFPRPINDKTLVLAKLLHVFIYLLRMVLPMSLASLVVLGFSDGLLSPLLYLIPLLLTVCLALFVVNSIYLIILNLTKPEKFKDIISYFQILASVVFFAIFYLRPKMVFASSDSGVMLDTSKYQWMRYLPTYWLATLWSALGYPSTYGNNILWTVLGIVTPLLCAFVLIKFLSPSFAKKIGGIDGAETADLRQVAKTGKAPAKRPFYLIMANLFNSSSEAKAGFIISWLQTSRSRAFRMRVFPSFAVVPFYFISVVKRGDVSFSEAFAQLATTSKHLLLLYMSSYVLINGMNYLVISDSFKAAWVYYSSPAPRPGKIMVGALKAMWVKYFLPFFILLSIFTFWIWGSAVIMDVLLALVNVTLMAVCIARVSFRQLPFSMKDMAKQKGGKIIRSMLTMFIPFTLGFTHYFAMEFWWLKTLFLILSSIFLWLVWDSYASTTWENVIQEEMAS